MNEKKTSVLSNGLIWFGAAVSIAEILTGTYVAPLGFAKGISAILLGHAIGCVLLFLVGLIGAKSEKSAMETVKGSFGQKGSYLFSSLNVLQLVGWTAIMVIMGASAATMVVGTLGNWFWCIIIGLLIIVWLLVGVRNLGKINSVTMIALFVLTVILSLLIFNNHTPHLAADAGSISFGGAVELAVAMPLSWLPLISDYTRTAEKPVRATFISSLVYFFTSSWMYIIGMGAAMLTLESDITSILIKAGLGVLGLIIVIAATVTTTFMDAYSAGVSLQSIFPKLKEKPSGIAITVVGVVLAMAAPMTQFENFLYLIGSVFAPMAAIQIADNFILKQDLSGKQANWPNLAIWLVGFILYRILLKYETPVGITLPTMLITIVISIAYHKLTGVKEHVKKQTCECEE